MQIEEVQWSRELELFSILSENFNRKILTLILDEPFKKDNTRYLNHFRNSSLIPLSKTLTPRLFEVSDYVLKKLSPDVPITVYLTHDPRINALSIPRGIDEDSHAIILNSGIVNWFNENELEFVIGHETGHLIFEHHSMDSLLQYIYPEKKTPPYIENRWTVWRQCSEITSDRVGLLACDSFEDAVSVMVTLYSGVRKEKMGFTFSTALENIYQEAENEALYRHFEEKDHPPIPSRIKALKQFSDYMEGGIGNEDLDRQMEDLFLHIINRPLSDYERLYIAFLFASGTIIAGTDGVTNENEKNFLLNRISQYIYIGNINIDISEHQKEQFIEDISELSEIIKKKYPDKLEEIFLDLSVLAFIDGKMISDNEVEALTNIGKNYLGLKNEQMFDSMRKVIQSSFYTPYSSQKK